MNMTAPRTILLAEDDPNMNFMLRDNLEMAGYQVDAFEDGQSALNAFAKKKHDLCVLDVMLPRKDGFRGSAGYTQTQPARAHRFCNGKRIEGRSHPGLQARCR